MNPNQQDEWITKHIPHRVRAAIARLDLEKSLLRVKAVLDPILQTDTDKVYWRCAGDSIWEGRLAATRWLIEFVGIRQSKGGTSTVCEKRVPSEDVRIDDFDGGRLLDHLTDDGKLLASVWKGCSLASSHATNCHHPSVSDQDVLPKALAIIVKHLQDTIYQKAGKELRDYVLERV